MILLRSSIQIIGNHKKQKINENLKYDKIKKQFFAINCIGNGYNKW